MKKILFFLFVLVYGFGLSQSDCVSAVPLCGNSGISYTPSNSGNINETLTGCVTKENFSAWYSFTVQTSGTLTFVITPNSTNDYDWTLFGPNVSCGNLGTPIRCSYAAPSGGNYQTGLNMTATDLSEGATGDGFVKYLDVVAGQTYYLMVDNYLSTAFGFSMTFGGTAVLGSPFTQTLQPFPFVAPGNPPANPNSPNEISICSIPTLFNFQSLNPGILNGNTNFQITWHYTANTAVLGTNAINTPINVSPNQIYYYRIKYVNPNDPNDPISNCFQTGSVKFVLNNLNTLVANKTLKACPPLANDAAPVWDLSSANVYSGTAPVTTSYHETLADAQSGANPIANPTAYSALAPKTIYVRVVDNASQCKAYPTITLSYHPGAVVTDATLSQCQNAGGPWVFDLATATVTTGTGNTIKYYPTQADATAGTNEITAFNSYPIASAGTHTVFAVVTTANQCRNFAKITLKANENPTLTTTTLKACNINGQGTFNLTSAVLTQQQNLTYTYYTSQADAQANTNPIANPSAYTVAPGIVFAKAATAEGCFSIIPITLELYPLPIVDLGLYNFRPCDDNLDGVIEVNFNNVTTATVSNASLFTVKYYLNQADAQAGNSNSLPNVWSYSAPTTVYMSIISPNGCSPVVKTLNFGFGGAVPITTPITKDICDEDLDGIINVDLNAFTASFTQDNTVTAKYFATLANAQNNVNPISGVTSVSQSGTYYVRFEKTGICPSLGKLVITVKMSKKSAVLRDKYICISNTTTLDAGPGYTSYEWNTGATTQSISNVPVGTYWVKLGFNGCFYTQKVDVLATPDPVITEVKIENNNVEIIVNGGTPPYEYSLDGVVWQSSNIFKELPRGENKIFVRDSNRCLPITYTFTIVNLVNAITPNGDGANDYLDYSALVYKKNLKMMIFDRYGKEVFNSEYNKEYRWDGKFQGRALNTGTYWYVLTFNENNEAETPVKYSGWIMLKNRD